MNAAFAELVVDRTLRHIWSGSLVIIRPDGRRVRYGSRAPEATMVLHTDEVWGAFLGGSLRLAEAYADGQWDSPDLVAVIRLAARNMPRLDRLRDKLTPAVRPLELLRAYRRPTGKAQNRNDIAAHYDLGNRLFERMLDPTLTYSCAVFDSPELTLEQAQRAKLERVCRKLDLGPRDRVLEIGTGWGSFAMYAASTYGCRITTTTISQEQYDHVLKAVAAAGLADRITVLFEDYSELTGRYDRLVSIEMIEAVGWQNIQTFLAKCSDLLEPSGAMLLQAITIDDRAYDVEKASRSFIKEHIFPGASLPSLAVLAGDLAKRTDFQLRDLDDLTPHYVETLRRWRQAFEAHSAGLQELGYDERFRRIWRLYLAYCEGGFAERRICDSQLLLTKPRYRPGSAEVESTALEDVSAA